MIEKIYGKVGRQVTCDNCGDGFESDSYAEAVTRIDEDGWKRRGGMLLCSDCLEVDMTSIIKTIVAYIIGALILLLLCSGVLWLIVKIWQSIGGMV